MSKSQALAVVLTRPEEWPDNQARILDTDLATLAEMTQPRNIRGVIKGYEESGDLGRVSQRTTAVRYESRPGIWQEREVTAYYLDEEQALFILAKLETPPAKAVTRGVISAFVAMRRGEVFPAVVAPSNDHTATLNAIVKSLEHLAARDQRAIVEIERVVAGMDHFSKSLGAVDSKVGAVAHQVGVMGDKVDVFGNRLDAVEKTLAEDNKNQRLEFHDSTKRRFRAVVFHSYDGLCPCCQQAKVLDSPRGQVYGAYDHWEARRRIGVEEGWLVCIDCNNKLGPAGHDWPQRRAYHWRFEEFQKRRRAHEDRQLSLLPGGQDGR